MLSTGACSSYELQRLGYMTEYEDSSPSNGCQATCSIIQAGSTYVLNNASHVSSWGPHQTLRNQSLLDIPWTHWIGWGIGADKCLALNANVAPTCQSEFDPSRTSPHDSQPRWDTFSWDPDTSKCSLSIAPNSTVTPGINNEHVKRSH